MTERQVSRAYDVIMRLMMTHEQHVKELVLSHRVQVQASDFHIRAATPSTQDPGSCTASLMMDQVSGTSLSYSALNARFPGRGAPKVYTWTLVRPHWVARSWAASVASVPPSECPVSNTRICAGFTSLAATMLCMCLMTLLHQSFPSSLNKSISLDALPCPCPMLLFSGHSSMRFHPGNSSCKAHQPALPV